MIDEKDVMHLTIGRRIEFYFVKTDCQANMPTNITVIVKQNIKLIKTSDLLSSFYRLFGSFKKFKFNTTDVTSATTGTKPQTLTILFSFSTVNKNE